MTKIQMTLQIVDWEHRYMESKLLSGGWVIHRVGMYMEMPMALVRRHWEELFL